MPILKWYFLLLLGLCTSQNTAQPVYKKNLHTANKNRDSLKKASVYQKKQLVTAYAAKEIKWLITKVANGQFGYYIFCDGQLIIDQKNIPGIPGNNGFKTIEDATKTAKLAIVKIKQGNIPPTITKKELLNLKIQL
jgi:hypothetical protein